MNRLRSGLLLFLLGAGPVLWFALKAAPYREQGLLSRAFFDSLAKDPAGIVPCADSLPFCLGFLALWGAVSCVLVCARPDNLRMSDALGSARWCSPASLNRRYRDRTDPDRNRILTRRVRMGLDPLRHNRNLNVLVVGGSGSGKTRTYVLPNLLQCSGSYFAVDPKGELLKTAGGVLEAAGYDIRVLDLNRMERSHCYNPFVYLETDADVQKLATNLFRNTSQGTGSKDPFWDTAAQMLLLALLFYLRSEAPPAEQNFSTVLEMIRAGDVDEEHGARKSPLDVLFDRLEDRDPGHVALKYYRSYRSGAAKTLKSIQITLLSHLDRFNLEAVASLTAADELCLDRIGERKTALFAVIPENDTSFNFLVGMLYTQLFQQLYARADHLHGGTLPVPVHILADEFANVALPEDFDKILSTMRSRGISISIILQNMTQLKALYEKQWQSIAGNCDTFLYLGGNEDSTHDYVSRQLGKETIRTRSGSRSRGRSGSFSESDHLSPRELLTPDEVRRIPGGSAILLLRGEPPVRDEKYRLRDHRRIRGTTEGGAPPYEHGADRLSVLSVRLPPGEEPEPEPETAHPFEVLTPEEWAGERSRQSEKEVKSRESQHQSGPVRFSDRIR